MKSLQHVLCRIGTGGVALALSVAAGCSGNRPIAHVSQAPKVSHLFVMTASGDLEEFALTPQGLVASRRKVGPLLQPQPGVSVVSVNALRASQDGKWLAWSEQTVPDPSASAADGQYSPLQTVLLDRSTGRTQSYGGIGSPVAFTPDDSLVTADPGTAGFSVIQNGTVGVRVSDLPSSENSPFAAVPGGVLGFAADQSGSSGLPSTMRLDMVGYDGIVKTLVTLPPYSAATTAYQGGWLDPKGRVAMVELGDHTDYCGAGPTSTVTVVDLITHQMTQVPGPREEARLRLESLQLTGASAGVAIWSACVGSDFRPIDLSYRLDGGSWSLLRRDVIAVAALDDQTFILQPGLVHMAAQGDGSVRLEPTANAQYLTRGHATDLPFKATQMFWTR